MNDNAGHILFQIGWMFFAYGPQLALCLWFAYSAGRRARGDLLNWLTVGFLWSLLPLAGVVIMWWLWRRAASGAGQGAPRHAGEKAARTADDPETTP